MQKYLIIVTLKLPPPYFNIILTDGWIILAVYDITYRQKRLDGAMEK